MSEDKCPVCAEHDQADADMSMGLILTAAKAVLDHDTETIKACFDSFTSWDTHIAITLLMATWVDLCAICKRNPHKFLEEQRERFNAAQATP